MDVHNVNKKTFDVMLHIFENSLINQRNISEKTHYSLGSVNKSIKELRTKGLLKEDNNLSDNACELIYQRSPKSAVILAAGLGLRMVPVNQDMPKALIRVREEVLVERLIRQLHEAGITDIYIVVGYMKEQFEYLIDEYNVQLIVNQNYAFRNNLTSLSLVSNLINNTYIVPCDIYCKINPFKKHELYSWYMIGNNETDDYAVHVSRNFEIRKLENEVGNKMIGIAYICSDIQDKFLRRLNILSNDSKYYHSYWEEVLFEQRKMMILANIVDSKNYIEINTYEQLIDFDQNSDNLDNDAIQMIEDSFHVGKNEIKNIEVLKKGMTNRSFYFTVDHKKYIMRIPGEGTSDLINRFQEFEVYEKIKHFSICDEIVSIDPKTGYKITSFIENARTCDSNNLNDLEICMRKLRTFHSLNIQVNHDFNLFEKIEFYQSLWKSKNSIYKDYLQIKQNVFSLKQFIDTCEKTRCLTHIDAVPDNFLIYGNDEVRLIDWEYAGMQDPHVDIAMFCIYALYDKTQIDQLIDIYFENECDKETRIKIYAYISICGLLWSNWCEYKRDLGIEFGEYSIRQYRYAKEYYKIVQKELGENCNE